MAENYYITLEIHDEGEWPRIAPENLMQHVDVRLPSGQLRQTPFPENKSLLPEMVY